jgi:orotidine-5'-phosphate decarboxylase
MVNFGDRLTEAIRRKKTPAMVGIDPRPDLLPQAIRNRFALGAGTSPRVWARAVHEFCSRVLDVVSQHIPAVKFQSAFFEMHGAPGIAALHALVRKAHRLGLVTVLDAKRGDIGSTSTAYAEAAFGLLADEQSERATEPMPDAITVSPYLGKDSLEPFIDYARHAGRGIFVLVRTSNSGSRDLQQLTTPAGTTIYRIVAEWVKQWSDATRGQSGYGSVGAVVGATAGDQIAELRTALPGSWLLIPGYGAQGAKAADLASGFDDRGFGAIVNNSREILFPPLESDSAPNAWEPAIEAALIRMIDDLARFTSAGRLRTE